MVTLFHQSLFTWLQLFLLFPLSLFPSSVKHLCAFEGEEENLHVFTMEVTPTSSTTVSTPIHQTQEQPVHVPPVKMVSFSAEVSEIPRNSLSPESEDYDEEETEETQTETSSSQAEGEEVDDTDKEFAQALEEMAEIVATPLIEETSPPSSSPGPDRETSSSLSPSPAPEGVDKPKGPPTKPKHASASPCEKCTCICCW